MFFFEYFDFERRCGSLPPPPLRGQTINVLFQRPFHLSGKREAKETWTIDMMLEKIDFKVILDITRLNDGTFTGKNCDYYVSSFIFFYSF